MSRKFELIKEGFVYTLAKIGPWILPLLMLAYVIGYYLRGTSWGTG